MRRLLIVEGNRHKRRPAELDKRDIVTPIAGTALPASDSAAITAEATLSLWQQKSSGRHNGCQAEDFGRL